MKIEGKTILVTGATGGIGAAICHSLSSIAGRIVLAGRNTGKLESLCRELSGKQTYVAADMATAAGRDILVSACKEHRVDVVINTAGTLDFNLVEDQSPAAIQAMIELNLTAPILLSQALIPVLSQRQESALVFIGSTFGSIGHPGFSAYCASKFGLRGFVESLRREVADTSINVFYLAPRATNTELNSPQVNALNESLGNAIDEPAQVAQTLIKLLGATKGKNAYIGWPEKLFVRINSLLPGVVDNALIKKLSTVKQHARKTQSEAL